MDPIPFSLNWLFNGGNTLAEWIRTIEERSPTTKQVQSVRIHKIEHFKDRGMWDHEHIIVFIYEADAAGNRPNEQSMTIFGYDRDFNETFTQKSRAYLAGDPISAIDNVGIMNRSKYDALCSKSKLLRSLEFQRATPTVLEIVAVAHVHSRSASHYHILTTMCIWLAGSTFDVFHYLTKDYDGLVYNKPCLAEVGKWKGFTVYDVQRHGLVEADNSPGFNRMIKSLCEADEKIERDTRTKADQDAPAPRSFTTTMITKFFDDVPPHKHLIEDTEQLLDEQWIKISGNVSDRERAENAEQEAQLQASGRRAAEQEAQLQALGRRAAEQEAQREASARRLAEERYKRLAEKYGVKAEASVNLPQSRGLPYAFGSSHSRR